MKGILGGFLAGARPGPLDDAWYELTNRFRSDAGVLMTPERALGIAGVYACSRVLAETLGQVPLILYRRLPDGGKERATDQPLYDVLHDQPNGWQTSSGWREQLQTWAGIRGNGYSKILSGPSGAIEQLIPLEPDRMTPVQLDNYRVVYRYQNKKTNQIEMYSQDEILHIRGWLSDGVEGLPLLQYAAQCFGLAYATESYGARLFSQGVKPGGLYKTPNKLSEQAQNNLKASFKESQQGLQNAHSVMVLEEGLEYQATGLNNEEAQFLGTRQFQLDEICRWFRMPPHMVQNLMRSTNNNIEQQSLEFVQYTMGPWFARWEQEINRTLVRPTLGNDYFVEFLLLALERADSAARAAFYESAIRAGWMMRNEPRERENMNKLPGLDQPVESTKLGIDSTKPPAPVSAPAPQDGTPP